MPRLFVAIDPPGPVSDALRTLANHDVSARWTSKLDFHLTLKFIGRVDERKLKHIGQSLTSVTAARPRVALTGLSVFPSWKRPRVIVARVLENSALTDLYRKVEDALHDAGIERENRPFRPHITVSRLRKASPEAVRAYVKNTQFPDITPFDADRFFLYESRLHRTGAEYARIAEYPIDPTNHP